MSWDATLFDDRGHVEFEQNYTHNTNGMIVAASEAVGAIEHREFNFGARPWWSYLDGMTGPEGAAFLHIIVVELECNPERYDPMNPPNGWGSRESLVPVLRAMRDAVPEWPTEWCVSG